MRLTQGVSEGETMAKANSKFRSTLKLGTGLVTAASLVLASSAVANAAGPMETVQTKSTSFTIEDSGNRAQLVEAANELSNYSQRDVLELLLAGTGPIAAANPSLERTLGFSPDRPAIEPEALKTVVDAYNTFNPSFASKMLPRLTSSDPVIFEKAVLDFYANVQKFIESETPESANQSGDQQRLNAAAAKGTVNVNTGVNVNIGMNIQVGLNVLYVQHAGAAVIAVAAALVLVLVVYLDDKSMNSGKISSIDQKKQLRSLRAALAN